MVEPHNISIMTNCYYYIIIIIILPFGTTSREETKLMRRNKMKVKWKSEFIVIIEEKRVKSEKKYFERETYIKIIVFIPFVGLRDIRDINILIITCTDRDKLTIKNTN